MDGLFHGKSKSKIRMMTGGSPYFRKPTNSIGTVGGTGAIL